MDKLKNVLSGGSHKGNDVPSEGQTSGAGDVTGERSNIGTNTSTGNASHPIYDQFTGSGRDQPSAAPGNESRLADTPGVHTTSAPNASSNLRPNSAGNRPTGTLTDEASTASIRSGVIGFGQSPEQHAALPNTGHGLSHKADNDNLRSDGQAHATGMPTVEEQSNEPRSQQGMTSDRSFPLAGGVTSRRQENNEPSTHNAASSTPGISERDPGTKEREAGVREGHGREGLAGAAAGAAAAYAAHPRSDNQHDQIDERGVDSRGTPGASTGASPPSPSSKKKWDGTWAGKQEVDSIDPCDESGPDKPADSRMFTEGPHTTDTANRYDPHLHMPGEFPETPMETPGDKSHAAGGILPGSGQPSTSELPTREKSGEHHYGRDAALGAGALGAGAAAYGAGKHHEPEHERQGDNEPLPEEKSPYSSQQVDPRVDARQPGGFDEQRFDPSATSVTAPAVSRSGEEDNTTNMSGGNVAAPDASVPTSNFARELEQPKDHHYGRDAALAGGAATAGGLGYAATRSGNDSQVESGPASSTIGPHKSNIANIMDPRVQPDPALQKHHQAGPTATDPASATVGPHKSNAANIADPRVLPEPEKQKGHAPSGSQPGDEHHYGRDAALGAGGAGTAAEAAHQYQQHRATQPSAVMDEQRYDPTARKTPEQEHHYGRDAAIAGGAGAAGLGAYGLGKDKAGDHAATSGGHYPEGQYAAPGMSQQQPTTFAREQYDPSLTREGQASHKGRDAAGAAGVAGAAGAGAYAYDHDKHAKEAEKAEKAHAKELEKQQKHHQHELDKNDKAFQSEQKKLEKQHTKEKEHNKLVAAENKKHEKEARQAEREQDREPHAGRDAALATGAAGTAGAGAYAHERDEDNRADHPGEMEDDEKDGKKKHKLFGFLHRDKSKKSPSSSPRASGEQPRGSQDYQGRGSHEGTPHEGRHKLHKDPPEGHPAREALANHQREQSGGHHQHIGTDGPIGSQ